MHDPVDITTKLAQLLDAADHSAAVQLLAPQCVYDFRGSEMIGRDAIMASYDAAHQDAVKTFDEVGYDSAVRADPDDDSIATIRYGDILTKNGVTHRHECEQRITVDRASGLVAHIKHIDLPGERDRLNVFLESVGLPARPKLSDQQ